MSCHLHVLSATCLDFHANPHLDFNAKPAPHIHTHTHTHTHTHKHAHTHKHTLEVKAMKKSSCHGVWSVLTHVPHPHSAPLSLSVLGMQDVKANKKALWTAVYVGMVQVCCTVCVCVYIRVCARRRVCVVSLSFALYLALALALSRPLSPSPCGLYHVVYVMVQACLVVCVCVCALMHVSARKRAARMLQHGAIDVDGGS